MCKDNSTKLFSIQIFALNDKFCDASDLEESWTNNKIPEPILNFFGALFNFDSKQFYSDSNDEGNSDSDGEEKQDSGVSESRRRKMFALYQILYF